MNFRVLLEKEHSKELTTSIANEIGDSTKKMKELMTVFFKGPNKISQRAAWVFSHAIETHPDLINDYYEAFIKLLNTDNKHNAINRNILKSLQYKRIPENYQGEILDVCFKLLNSPSEAIAVKVYAMIIIEQLAEEYPEILPELKTSIQLLLPNASSGIKNRGNKILKRIS